MRGKLLKNTIWNTFFVILSSFGRFFALIILARILIKSDLGKISYLLWLIAFFCTVAEIGVSNAVRRNLSLLKGEDNHQELEQFRGWIARFFVLAGLVSSIFLWFLWYFRILVFSRHSFFWLSQIFLYVSLFERAYQAILTGEQQFRQLSWLGFLSGLLLPLGTFLGAYFFGVEGGFAGYILGSLPYSFLFVAFFFRHFRAPKLPFEKVKRIWHYSFFLWLNGLMGMLIWSRTEILLIERWYSSDEIADFTIAVSMSGLLYQFATLLLGALVPHMSETYGKSGPDGVLQLYQRANRFMILLIFPTSFGFAAVSPIMVRLLYGDAYISSIPSVLILIPAAIFIVSGVAGSGLYALEDSKSIFYASIYGGVAFVLLAFFFIPPLGSLGASIVKFCSRGVYSSLLIYFFLRKFHLPFQMKTPVKVGMMAFFSCLPAFLLSFFFPYIFTLIPAILSGFVLYTLALKQSQMLHLSDFDDIKILLNRIPDRRLHKMIQSFIRWLSSPKTRNRMETR